MRDKFGNDGRARAALRKNVVVTGNLAITVATDGFNLKSLFFIKKPLMRPKLSDGKKLSRSKFNT
jgi:hypothetical protein